MIDILAFIIAIIFSLALLYIFAFSLGQLDLSMLYLKALKKQGNKEQESRYGEWPMVSIQLPVYNEKYVAERLLDAISNLDYPKDKMDIQVLDDSTDETVDILKRKIHELKNIGFHITQVYRDERKGFKAGALAHALPLAKGEIIAIFDADFLPHSNFLKKTVPYFSDPKLGVVQTRWGHINKGYSLLTKLQAFGLDAHFTVEQTGRSEAGSFINFNGTAGVWRKASINDAGGWSDDTLTEDLDLSYRAQLKGWKFKFVENIVAPAELPVLMSAVKTQQYRWNKGAAESARKNLRKVYRSKISFRSKIHATFHLLNSSVFVSLLVAAVISLPMLFIKSTHPVYQQLFKIGLLFLVGFLSISIFYWIAYRRIQQKHALWNFIKIFPLFLIVSMGLSLHNGVAVLEGLMGKKTPFIRTPKFNIMKGQKRWSKNVYIRRNIDKLTIFEGILALYFIIGIIFAILRQDFGLVIFHSMLALGFASVFYYSVKPIINEQVQ